MLHFLFVSLQLLSTVSFADSISLKQSCLNYLQNYPSYFKDETLDLVCEKVQQSEGCKSSKDEPIFHADFKSQHEGAKKIMVISLIHGDETNAGSVGRYWMERLQKIDPRNSWRIIPVDQAAERLEQLANNLPNPINPIPRSTPNEQVT